MDKSLGELWGRLEKEDESFNIGPPKEGCWMSIHGQSWEWIKIYFVDEVKPEIGDELKQIVTKIKEDENGIWIETKLLVIKKKGKDYDLAKFDI